MSAQLIHLCNELSRIDNIPKDKKYENRQAYSKNVIYCIIQILDILYPMPSIGSDTNARSFMKEFLIISKNKNTNTKQLLNITEFLHYLYKHKYIEESSIHPSIICPPDITTHSNDYYYILENYPGINVELEDKTIDDTEIDNDFVMDEYEYIFMLDTKIQFIILLFLHFKLIKGIKKNYIPDLNIATAQLLLDMA